MPLLTAAAVAAACSGDEGPPAPEFEPTDCSLLWYRARSGGVFDLYKVEMPAADWAPGTRAYDGTSRLGVFYYGLFDADEDGLFEQWENAATATAGTFTIGGDGADGGGGAVQFSDDAGQSYVGLGGALLATGGTGTFAGVWSDHEVETGDADPEYADGASIALTYAGSSLTFGSAEYVAFGYCWSDPASATGTALRSPARRPRESWQPEAKTP